MGRMTARSMLLWTALAIAASHPAQSQSPGADAVRGAISGRAASELSRGQADSSFGRLVKLSLSVGATKGQFKSARYQQNDHVLLQQFADGTLLVWDFDQGGQVDEFKLPAAAIPVHYDEKTSHLYIISDSRLYRVRRSEGTGPAMEVVVDRGARTGASSGDGNSMFVATAAGSVIKMTADGKTLWQKEATAGGAREIISNQEGTQVVVLGDAGDVIALDEAKSVKLALPGVTRLIDFDRAGKQFTVVAGREILTISTEGQITGKIALEGAVQSVSRNMPGDRYVAVAGDGRLSLSRGAAWNTVDQGVRYAAFLDGKRYLYVKDNGVAYLRALDVDHYLLSLVPSTSGWVIVDHEGRYDGTVGGTKDVSWKAGGEALNMDQFFENYYRPGLLASYLKEQDGELARVPANFKEGVYLAPRVELDFPEGKMIAGKEFRVVAVGQSRGGTFAEGIRLFHNGKRLPLKARIGTQTVKKGEQLLLVEVFAFVPVAGLNEVYAEASNSSGVTGRSEVRKVLSEGTQPAGKLRIVGVGVDKYQDSSMNLSYAVTDVNALLTRIDAGAKGFYKEIVIQRLADEGATRGGVRTLLESLQQADPQDSLLVILAGHGDTTDGEWYFMPHDTKPGALSASSISAREIQDALVNSPAKQIFLVVDACNSGAGIDSFNRYRNFQRRFAQQVGRSAGVAVLTAARRDQGALEARDIGHGLFTYTLLEGLAGAADTTPRDSKVSAHEIAQYVADNLRQKALKLTGPYRLRQDPAHFVIGSDFLVSNVGR